MREDQLWASLMASYVLSSALLLGLHFEPSGPVVAMEDEKLQRLHDTLEKLRPKGKTGGLGFGSAWGGVPGKPEDDLPKNGLYSYFVRSGQSGYKKWTDDDDATEEQEPQLVSGADEGESTKKKKRKRKKKEEEEEDDEVGSKHQRKDKKKSKMGKPTIEGGVEQESIPKEAESEVVEAERHGDNTRKKKRPRYSEAEEGKEPVLLENKVEKEGKKRRKAEGEEEVVVTAEQVESNDAQVSDLTSGFEWHKHIKKVLKKAEGRRMCLKALRKEVVTLARQHHEEVLGTAPDKKALKTVFKQIVGSIETLTVEDGHVVYSRRRSVEETTSNQDTDRIEEGPVEELTQDLVEGGEEGSKEKKKKKKRKARNEQAEE